MATFIIPVNPRRSFLNEIFKDGNTILWIHKRGYPKYQEGDILYMYISSPVKEIYFKARVNRTNVQANLEELSERSTWIKEEDLEEQVRNNNNDEIELIRKVPENLRSQLSIDALSSNGFMKNFPFGKPVNISDNERLIHYIESVIEEKNSI